MAYLSTVQVLCFTDEPRLLSTLSANLQQNRPIEILRRFLRIVASYYGKSEVKTANKSTIV